MAQAAADYTRARTIIEQGDAHARAALAGDPATLPEILFFLSEDAEADVRRAVAGNRSTPPQADSRLARDPDLSVRCALARKLVGDGLPDGERRNLRRMGFTILETLARDRVVRVRQLLAEALAAPADAPRTLVVGLARDPARAVAAPVLRSSPVLTEGDVVAILADGAPDWAQEAIAGRTDLPPAVTRALAEAGSVPAVARMIANDSARIEDPTMERLVARAAEVPQWQAPLVARPKLAPGILAQLARVIAAPLLGMLRRRPDLDAVATAEIERRGIAPQGVEPEAAIPQGRQESPAKRARRLHRAKALTDNALAVALENGEQSFVIEALALRAGLPGSRVRRMVAVKKGKTMMALAWKAGLAARFGMELQRALARVPPRDLVNARDGLDFPFSPAEMTAHLALFED